MAEEGGLSECRAVLFDLDDTLLDGDTAWHSGMTRLLARCPQVTWEAGWAAWETAFLEHFHRYLAGELTNEESRVARIRTWAALTEVTVAPGSELAWFAEYEAGYRTAWAAFDDVAPCLAALSGLLPLGVITNGESVMQRDKLVALGIDSHFTVVVASGDIGIAKPDPRIFHHAASGFGLPPERCLVVGDRHDADILGARAAGMRAVWLNRRGTTVPDAQTTEITTLGELTELLAPAS